MTAVFRDGDYQSVAENQHPQTVPRGESWRAARFVDDDGHSRTRLDVVRPGVAHDVDYALRLDPQDTVNLVWHRIQRYPVVAGDNGTHWQGPIRTVPGEATYVTGHGLDRQNALAGRGYGVDIKARQAVTIDQFILKLDPRS